MRCWWESYRRHVIPKKMRSLLRIRKKSFNYHNIDQNNNPPVETMVCSEGPDRGHAWVVAITAGIITLILSGISKMVGILYVAVIDTYHVSREQATLPFTFRKSLRCLSGPIVGVMGQRFGIRSVTLGGAVVAATGAGLSFFAPTVGWLAVSWGAIHGTGEAFANTLFQVVVNQHFDKYRSTASGIALSGACVGSVFFSFLIEYLTDNYGLQGTFLILSGVILHVIPAAMLLKSPTWTRKGLIINNERTHLNQNLKNNPPLYVLPAEYIKGRGEKKFSVASLNPNLLEKNEIRADTNIPMKSSSTTNLVATLEKKLQNLKGVDNLAFAMDSKDLQGDRNLNVPNLFSTTNGKPNSRVCTRQTSLSEDFTDENSKKIAQKDNVNSLLSNLKTIAKLYTNPIYLLICVCMCCYVFVFIPIMTSMVDYSKDKGLPETVGKYLINTMAAGDIIGRLCFGWVTDKNLVSMSRYMILSLFLQGSCILLIPITRHLGTYMLLLALYSMAAGSMLVRLPVIVLKNVKKEEQSIAMGCYGFASGLVPFGVPGLIGHFRDNFGSYDGMYYLLGGLSFVSGLFWLLEPCLVRLTESQKENNMKNINDV